VTSRYGEPTDEHMRELILRPLSRERLELLERADWMERKTADAHFSDEQRADAAARARRCRRQAAHYQQAIDLLTAAPMPPTETP
jgi:hypothetical protein